MGSEAIEDAREVIDAVRRLVRGLRESSHEATRAAGIPGAQLFVLQQLRGAGPLSLREVAARTLTHESSVSVVVQHLVDAGLASRRRSPADARRAEISLTPRGRALLKRAPRLFQERLIDAAARLPSATRRGLAGGLRALVGGMGLAGRAPAMFFEEATDARSGRPRR